MIEPVMLKKKREISHKGKSSMFHIIFCLWIVPKVLFFVTSYKDPSILICNFNISEKKEHLTSTNI